MNKVIVISDSFKGTLSSAAIAEIAETCIHEVYPHCQVIGLPVADGGEGTVDCFLKALGGTRVSCTVQGPWQAPIEACYARIGATAVIEMAAAAGLPLAAPRLDPSRTTTYGVGELIRHAVTHGATHLILGLGGSATNDGGCGAAAALGTQFFNAAGKSFCPVGATLSEIVHINADETRALLQGVQVEVMCDIDNPLCGPSGAAAVFAPQKGADDAMVQRLDQGLSHLAQILAQDMRASVALLPGAGAAGGFGAGAAAFLGASLRPGIEVVLDLLQFSAQLRDCDLVITGEGRIDGQSLGGKVPVGVARRAKQAGVPVVAIVGVVGPDCEAVYDAGITAIFPTNREALPFSELAARAAEDYRRTLRDLLRYTRAIT